MSAEAALQVVKQIMTLADGPETPQMRACLSQVVWSLQAFLEHPDSRVRIGSARTLLKLRRGYETAMQKLDLNKAEAALARIVVDVERGAAAGDAEELLTLLSQALGRPVPALSAAPEIERAVAASSSTTPAFVPMEKRGQVVLEMAPCTDAKAKALIHERVVAISGAVSVTFEGNFIVISTRSEALASDVAFLRELLGSLGREGVSLTLVSPSFPEFNAPEAKKTIARW
eukprot:NODE_6207_length_1694_cov_6.150606.p1 GENE.NODE_6207_length_1694_cov_6.150606~~NODE_6207_length_1694_cov_6.150606.p1  ORF type:complete len:230 (-),score=53.91 NODE_6207_length_1694_cov_6.150606:867-1556(-)